MAADRYPEKLSPLRSLSSFKSEIPLTMEDTRQTSKSFHQYLDHFINSIPLHVTVLVLIVGNCFVVSAELLFAFNMIMHIENSDRDMVLRALSATSLAILSVFLLEVVVRIFIMGASFRRRRLEVFDACIVLLTFVTDLVFFVSNLQTSHPFTRAFSFLIALRLWRCWGILRVEKKRAREETACELEMEKYARRQAEAQADALQAQCDQQLKEIAYLRDFLLQHNLDLDSTKLDFVPNYRTSASLSTSAIDYDKADTVRVNGKISKDASLDSIASSTKDLPASLSSSQNLYSEAPSLANPSTPQNSPGRRKAGGAGQGKATPQGHATREADARQGHANAGFTPDNEEETEKGEGVPEKAGGAPKEKEGGTGQGGVANAGFEGDAADSDCSVETDSIGDSEVQLRIELDEIRRYSEEALQAGLVSSTTEVDGIPTTSL